MAVPHEELKTVVEFQADISGNKDEGKGGLCSQIVDDIPIENSDQGKIRSDVFSRQLRSYLYPLRGTH